MKFELDEEQVNKLDKWKEAIKEVFGEYGNYDYIFNNNSGIGQCCKVYSYLADKTIDLTDVSKW
jgi:hypothetical protein